MKYNKYKNLKKNINQRNFETFTVYKISCILKKKKVCVYMYDFKYMNICRLSELMKENIPTMENEKKKK